MKVTSRTHCKENTTDTGLITSQYH